MCLTMFLVFNTVHYYGGLPPLVCSANPLSPDGVSVLEIKSSFAVPPNVLSSWRNDSSSHVDPCSWEGVHCSPNGKRVISISLPYRGLSGRLSSAIGNMVVFEKLDVSGNSCIHYEPVSDKQCEEQISPRSMDRYESQCFSFKIFWLRCMCSCSR